MLVNELGQCEKEVDPGRNVFRALTGGHASKKLIKRSKVALVWYACRAELIFIREDGWSLRHHGHPLVDVPLAAFNALCTTTYIGVYVGTYVCTYVCMCVVLKMHLMYVLDEKVEEHIARVQANCNMFAWAPVDLEEVALLHH